MCVYVWVLGVGTNWRERREKKKKKIRAVISKNGFKVMIIMHKLRFAKVLELTFQHLKTNFCFYFPINIFSLLVVNDPIAIQNVQFVMCASQFAKVCCFRLTFGILTLPNRRDFVVYLLCANAIFLGNFIFWSLCISTQSETVCTIPFCHHRHLFYILLISNGWSPQKLQIRFLNITKTH